MKKTIFKTLFGLTLFTLLFSNCRKLDPQTESATLGDGTAATAQSAKNDDDEAGCRLKHVDYGTGYTLDFKFNRKGLTSEVLLSYSDGYFERHSIFYNSKDELIRTRIVSSDFDPIVFNYSHSGDKITRAYGYFETTQEPWRDIRYSYNRNGQMTKLDDVFQDVHMKYFYNNRGNMARGEFYLGTDLYFVGEYKYDIPNRNPFLALKGVPFGFWDFFLPLWDRQWESSDYAAIYENGSPVVVTNTDPRRTTMHTGRHNYLLSATKYDQVTESYYTESMSYANCDGHEEDYGGIELPIARPHALMSPVVKLQRILAGPAASIKARLVEFKSQTLRK